MRPVLARPPLALGQRVLPPFRAAGREGPGAGVADGRNDDMGGEEGKRDMARQVNFGQILDMVNVMDQSFDQCLVICCSS